MSDNDGPREVFPVMMEEESPITDFRPIAEKIDPEADPKDWSAPELAELSDEPDADSVKAMEELFPELVEEIEDELPPPTPVSPEPPASVEKELPKAPKVAVGKSTS